MGVPQEKGRKRTTGSRTGELPRLCSCPSLPSHAEDDAEDQLRKERPSSAMKDEELNPAGFSSRLT